MWFMDAASLGGFTAEGTATVLQEKLISLTPDERPSWMEKQTPDQVKNILTKAILNAVEGSHCVQSYLDEEQAKGRGFEEIHAEVKPYIDFVSKPLTDKEREAWGNNKDVTGEERDADDAHADEGQGGGGGFPFFAGSAAGPGAYAAEAASASPYSEYMNLHEDKRPGDAKAWAPHRRLGAWPDDRSFMNISASSRSGRARTPERPPEVSDAVETQDLTESLMLLGTCNDWSRQQARHTHVFAQMQGHAMFQEYILRLEVPEGGLSFQIVSVGGRDRRELWIFPSGSRTTLKQGRMHHVEVCLKKGADAYEKAQGREFKIRDSAPPSVDVRVAMSRDRGMRVWFTEPSEVDQWPMAAAGGTPDSE